MIAFSCYYKCLGTNIGMMGTTMGDPDIEKELRQEAVLELLDYITKTQLTWEGIDYLYYATDKTCQPMMDLFVKKGGQILHNDAYIAVWSRKDAKFLK